MQQTIVRTKRKQLYDKDKISIIEKIELEKIFKRVKIIRLEQSINGEC